MNRALVLFFLFTSGTLSKAFLCQTVDEKTSWETMLETSSDFLILCPPFEIKGEACPSSMSGHVVAENSSLTILCDNTAFGGDTNLAINREGPNHTKRCVVDCPGTHFTIQANSRLTVDGFTLKGSTRPAIVVEPDGALQVFETKFENNAFATGNGGAVQASEKTEVIMHQCEFQNNTALSGGAIFVEGETSISFTKFIDNKSIGRTPQSGGGAIAIGMFAKTKITGCEFDRNMADNQNGSAVLDHSSGIDTILQGNRGCSSVLAGGDGNFCNGVQRLNSRGNPICEEFDVECEVATIAHTSLAPAATIMPTSDPCLDDPDSFFECVLNELLDDLP